MLSKKESKSIITICANIFAGIALILLSIEIIAAVLGKPSFLAIFLYSLWLVGSMWAKWYVKKIPEQINGENKVVVASPDTRQSEKPKTP